MSSKDDIIEPLDPDDISDVESFEPLDPDEAPADAVAAAPAKAPKAKASKAKTPKPSSKAASKSKRKPGATSKTDALRLPAPPAAVAVADRDPASRPDADLDDNRDNARDDDLGELDDPLTSAEDAGQDRRLLWFIGGLTLIGLVLRLLYLGDRAMHHDESLDAWYSWQYINGTFGGYDPVYHGPLRFYITAGFYWLFGEDEFSARLFSALSGTLLIPLPYLIRHQIGRVGAAAAAVGLCVSPTMLYYSRFGREDAQIAFLTGAMIVLACMYMRRPRAWIPIAFMFSLACSFAIKESTYIWIVIVGGFGLVVLAVQFHRLARGAIDGDDDGAERAAIAPPDVLLAATGIFLVIALFSWRFVGNAYLALGLLSVAMALVVLYARFDFERIWPIAALYLMIVTVTVGADLGIAFYLIALYGAVMFAVAFWKLVQARSAGASLIDAPIVARLAEVGWVPWAIAGVTLVFFFEAFFTGWFYQHPEKWTAGVTDAIAYWDSQQEVNRGGQPWYYYLVATPVYEWLFVGLAAVGTYRSIKKPTFTLGFIVWCAAASLILYSYAGERMPWLIVHPLLPVILLAGVGFHHLWQKRTPVTPLILGVVAFGLLWTSFLSLRSSFATDTDGRELLVQAGQATEHVEMLLDEIEALDKVSRAQLGRPATIGAATPNSWPWNWHFRDKTINWFNPKDHINEETGVLGLGSDSDIVIADWLATSDGGVTQWLDPAVAAPGYESRPFAMRSWWVPNYAGASVTYRDASPVDWLKYAFTLEAWSPGEDRRADCGSVDQYFLVKRELADAARRSQGLADPSPLNKLDCASPGLQKES